MNCIKCGKELINSAVCACDKIKLEEKLMGKKYRVKKDFWVFKKDVTMDFIFPISWVVEKLIKDGYIEEVKKEKPMEQKKYKVEKSLPINIGLLVGHIYDESYFKYLDIARIIKEEYIKEVKGWGKLESILTDFALRIQGGYGNPDYNFLDDVCEISNKISELQKEIK